MAGPSKLRNNECTMKDKLVEGLGWYGVVAIVGAYALVSFSAIRSDQLIYQILNLTGAVGIVIDATYAKNYQPAVLNIIWFVVAFIAIIRILTGV